MRLVLNSYWVVHDTIWLYGAIRAEGAESVHLTSFLQAFETSGFQPRAAKIGLEST